MTPNLYVLLALALVGMSWFVAAFYVTHIGRCDLVYRVWAITAGWFAASAVVLFHVPDDALGGWFVGMVAVSLGLSFVVDELIERRW